MKEALTSFVWMFWTQLCEMAPYLLLGFFVAGLLSIFLSPALVERHLGRGRFWPVIKATLLGLPMPLCSCGVIPVAASLRRHRAGRGPTVAFLISTPQTGVDNILVVYSLLGLVFAIFSPIVALVSGIAGGLLISFTEKRVPQDEPAAEEICQEACCQTAPRGGRLVQALQYGFGTLARDIARPLLVGLVVAALISVAVPREWVQASLGGSLGLIVAMVVSLPIYVCATASVPIAAAMIASGASPGAALVFLMTGPATNAATIMTVWKLMGPRAAGLYLFSTAGTALAAGATLNWLYAQPGVPDFVNIEHGAPGVFETIAAAALLAVLLRALVRGKTGPAEPQAMAAVAAQGEGLLLKVAGMTCDHCSQSVSEALLRCGGVATVAVDRPSKIVHVRGAKLNREELAAAVTEAGFSLEGIEEHAGAAEQTKGDHHD